MNTIDSVVKSMQTDVAIAKELDFLRRYEKRTNTFLDSVIYHLSCDVILKFLGLTDFDNMKYQDNLCVDPTHYTCRELKIIENIRNKYKPFCNKMVAHVTTCDVIAKATLNDLEQMVSLIIRANWYCCSNGALDNYLRPMLQRAISEVST